MIAAIRRIVGYLLALDTPFWILISLSLTGDAFRIEASKGLPRGERRALARRKLAREEQAQHEAVIPRLRK